MLKAWLLAGALALGCLSPAAAQTHVDKSGTIVPGVAPIYLYVSAGAAQFGVSITTGTTLTPPAGATLAVITVTGGSALYRDDGTAPTSSVGMPIPPNYAWSYAGPLSSISFTAASGSPTLNVLYYKAN